MGRGLNSKARKDRSRNPLHGVRNTRIGDAHRLSDVGPVADGAIAIKPPLRVDTVGDPSGNVRVVDANHMVVCRMSRFADALAMAEKIMRKLNDA